MGLNRTFAFLIHQMHKLQRYRTWDMAKVSMRSPPKGVHYVHVDTRVESRFNDFFDRVAFDSASEG